MKSAYDNAEKRLQKDQNGADIPDKRLFLRNIGATNSTTMSFSGGTGWFRLATVTMPQASSVRFVSGSIQSNKTINITGRVNPTDYGNFDSRYVRDIRLGGAATYKPANNGMTWTHQAPSGCIYSGIIVQDTGSNSADNIGGVYYRPVQKYINGTWYNVAQV